MSNQPDPKRPKCAGHQENTDDVDLSSLSPITRNRFQQILEENEKLKKVEKILRSKSLGQLLKHPPELTLKCVGSDGSHATGKSNHRNASATKVNAEVTLSEYTEDNGLFQIVSSVLAEFYEDDVDIEGKTYATKADISRLVAVAISDAIKLATKETGKKLYRRAEFSLWSNRPDHLMVYDAKSYHPIIAVEAKKPFLNGEGNSPLPGPVLGQVFDYLMQLRWLGHSAPFVVLTTFQDSWIFCESDGNGAKLLADGIKSAYTTALNKTEKAKDKTASPPELVGSTDDNDTISSSLFEEFGRRDNMVQSVRFDSKELVHLLYTAIICGLERNPLEKERITVGHKGFKGVALKLEEDSYQWGDLSYNGEDVIKWQDKGTSTHAGKCKDVKENTFFAIDTLGRGDTSVVFRAYDRKGDLHAIKMYVKRHEEKHEKGKGKQLCQLEVKRLTKFYPFLEGNVEFRTLNKFPCVIMPFLEPVPKEERKSEKVKKAVRQCLETFYKNKVHYSEDDLRWYHIAYFSNNENDKEMVMFDLAELEKGAMDVNIQVENLWKRLEHIIY